MAEPKRSVEQEVFRRDPEPFQLRRGEGDLPGVVIPFGFAAGLVGRDRDRLEHHGDRDGARGQANGDGPQIVIRRVVDVAGCQDQLGYSGSGPLPRAFRPEKRVPVWIALNVRMRRPRQARLEHDLLRRRARAEADGQRRGEQQPGKMPARQ